MAREANDLEDVGSAGKVWVWGLNVSGQLGQGNATTLVRAMPVKLSNGSDLTDAWSVSGGEAHTAIVRWKPGDPALQGTVWTCGNRAYGRLGQGSTAPGKVMNPEPVIKADSTPLDGIEQVASGAAHSLAVDQDGHVWAWGYNGYGQLGTGTTSNSAVAVQVKDPAGTGFLSDIVAVAAGGDGSQGSSLAIAEDGTIYTWGRNQKGQLGNGEVTYYATPLPIAHANNHVAGHQPSVTLSCLVIEAVAPGAVELVATPSHSGPGGVANILRVELFLNGRRVATRTESPWSTSVANLAGGVHHAYAMVYDNEGISVMSGSESINVAAFGGDDPDGDGLATDYELNHTLSNPNDPDTDGDGMRDGFEHWHGFPVLAQATGTGSGPDDDADNDGLKNREEQDGGSGAKMYGTNFTGSEVRSGTVRWFGCRGTWYTLQYSTNLSTWTTLESGFYGEDVELSMDLEEWYGGPRPSPFFVRLIFGDENEFDFDEDGLTAAEEKLFNTDPIKWDSDGDGFSDGAEVGNVYRSIGEGSDGGPNPNNDPLDGSDFPDVEWFAITGDLEEGIEKTRRRRVTIPKGESRLVVLALASDEFLGGYTAKQSGWNDIISWSIAPYVAGSGSQSLIGSVDVNTVHGRWVVAEQEGQTIQGETPSTIEVAKVFSAPASSDEELVIDLSAKNVGDGDYHSTVVVGLVPIKAADNIVATGVDEVSRTADSDDIGYQSKSWIMAPSGTVPAHAGGTGAEDCENDTRFSIPIGDTVKLKIIPAHSTALHNGEDVVPLVSDGNGRVVTWHGTSVNTKEETEAAPWIWRVGADEKPSDLPVGVKVMKNRTLKVVVWPIYQDPSRSNSLSEIFATEQSRVDYESELRTLLTEIFAFQLNAWIDVEVRNDRGFDYVYQSSNGVYYAQYDGAKEHQMISSIKDPDYHINIFLIDGFWYHSQDPASVPDVLTDAANGYSYVDGLALESRVNSAVVSLNNQTREMSRLTVAHEIGHLMVGAGHPDEYDVADPVPFGGVAAHQSLDLSEHQKRLMVSGANKTAHSRLLVKDEWDKAEDWLLKFIDEQEP